MLACLLGNETLGESIALRGLDDVLTTMDNLAVQRLPLRLLGDGGPVCAHRQFEDADESGEREGFRGDFT